MPTCSLYVGVRMKIDMASAHDKPMTIRKNIVLLPGDGIGPEIMRVAVRVLKECAAESGLEFDFSEFPFGGCAIDATGEPLPAETLAACRTADAILLGAVGGPKWDGVPLAKRPESGLLALRKALGLFINLRPIDLHAPLYGLSPLRADRARDVHIDFVRELAGDVYFGEHRLEADPSGERASDAGTYTTGKSSAWRSMLSRARKRGKADSPPWISPMCSPCRNFGARR